MPTLRHIIEFQLHDRLTGKAIIATGGKCLVTANAAQAKSTLLNPDSDMASLSNPISLSRGRGRFAVVAGSPDAMDLFIMAPGGQFVNVNNIGLVPGRLNPIYVDTAQRTQTLKLPYTYEDAGTGTTEYDTGFDLPKNAIVSPFGCGVQIVATDATEVLDVGLLSTESGGDADGFMADIPISGAADTALQAKETLTVGSNETFFASTTRGALIATLSAGTDVATDVGGVGLLGHRVDGTAVSISYTPSSWDTAKGYFFLTYDIWGNSSQPL